VIEQGKLKSRKPYNRSLNQDQLKLLSVVYSYRFVTRSSISEHLGWLNNTSFYTRLRVLLKHEYLGIHFNKSYRLAGREAEYFVTPKGLRALGTAKIIELTDPMLTAVYKDKTVSDSFLQQTVNLLRMRNKLASTHPNIQAFTARDVQSLDYFPKPRPDLFISMKNGNTVTRFFIEFIPATTADSRLKKRLEYYTRYYEESDWDVTGTPFPGILFIAETGLLEQGIRNLIGREQYRSDTDICYYTTTQKALLNATAKHPAVWTDINEPDDVLSLEDATN
jgi:hypothetical protein